MIRLGKEKIVFIFAECPAAPPGSLTHGSVSWGADETTRNNTDEDYNLEVIK